MRVQQPIGEPTGSAGDRIPFVSWNYVFPGRFRWLDNAGRDVSVVGDTPPGEAHLVRAGVATGVHLVVEAPRVGEPVLSSPPGYAGVSIDTLLQVDDVFRAWGHLRDREDRVHGFAISSTDGRVWELNAEDELSDAIGPTVFHDPHDEEWPFKAVGEHLVPTADARRLNRELNAIPPIWRPDVTAELAHRMYGLDVGDNGAAAVAAGWVSRDGLTWQELPEPILFSHTDTQIVVSYDEARGRYVGYFRGYTGPPLAESHRSGSQLPESWVPGTRRSIARAETEDFAHWPEPQPMMVAPTWMRPSSVLYTNGWTRFPGSRWTELMFPVVWDSADDSTNVYVATSTDGENWDWVGQDPILPTDEGASWRAGAVFARPGLIELPSGDFALPFTGYDVPHKYPRGRFSYAAGLAVFPKGRMVGVRAEGVGRFTSIGLEIGEGGGLLLNATHGPGGSIRAALESLEGQVIPGRSFDECDPIPPDAHGHRLTWRGGEDAGAPTARVRFELESATVYWLQLVGGRQA